MCSVACDQVKRQLLLHSCLFLCYAFVQALVYQQTESVCQPETKHALCRLAPACKFPAGLEESFTAACYAVQHAARLGCNPEKVAIAGDSAGGKLAAAVCLLAKVRRTCTLHTSL